MDNEMQVHSLSAVVTGNIYCKGIKMTGNIYQKSKYQKQQEIYTKSKSIVNWKEIVHNWKTSNGKFSCDFIRLFFVTLFLNLPQDPVDPAKTVIVIRSLVPDGVAEQDGRLLPGDRLMYVNNTNLENASLEDAVQALKGAKFGKVQIGVAKPLPVRANTFHCWKFQVNATY